MYATLLVPRGRGVPLSSQMAVTLRSELLDPQVEKNLTAVQHARLGFDMFVPELCNTRKVHLSISRRRRHARSVWGV